MKPSNNLENKANMLESSGSQLFTTAGITTGIQSGSDAFEKSIFIMTFLTIFGVTEILCSFKFVLEGKTCKETPGSSQEPSFQEVMDFFVLSAYVSVAASRTLLQRLLACLNFTLEAEDLSFWYKRKKWFLWTMAAAQAAENHGDEWGLAWYFLRGIYRSIPTWTHTQKLLAAAEAPSLKIPSHGTSHKCSWRPSQSERE